MSTDWGNVVLGALALVLAALLVGGIVYAIHLDSIRGDAQRDECIKLGRAWFELEGSCVPVAPSAPTKP